MKFRRKKQDKPQRISNKLDRVLIAESRQSLVRKWQTLSKKRKLVVIAVSSMVVIGAAGGVLALVVQKERPTPTPAVNEQKYDESTGSIIFEYKPPPRPPQQ